MSKGSLINKKGVVVLSLLAELLIAAVASPFLCSGSTADALAGQAASMPVYILAVILGFIVVPIVTTRMISPYISSNDINGAARVTLDCMMVCGISSGILGILLALAAPVVAGISGVAELSGAMRSVCTLLFVLPISGSLGPWFWCAGDYLNVGVAMVLPRLLFTLIAPLAFSGSAGSGSWWMAMLIAHAITLVFLAVMFVIQIKPFYKKSDINPFGAISKRWLRAVSQISLALIPFAAAILIDLFIVPSCFTPDIYAQASRIEYLGILDGSLMPAVLFLIVVILICSGQSMLDVATSSRSFDKRHVQAQIALSQKVCMIASIPAATLMAVLSKPILQLFFGFDQSEALLAGAASGVYLAPAIVFGSLGLLSALILSFLGHSAIAALNSGFFVAIKLLLTVLLATSPAIFSGAAAATSLSLFAFAAFNFIQLAKLTKAAPSPVNSLLKPMFASACMGATVYFLYFGLLEPLIGLFGSVIAAVVGLAIYLALIVALRAFSHSDYLRLPFGAKIISVLEHSGIAK